MTRRQRIFALFTPYRRPLATVLALIAFSAGLSMISPFLLREILDVALPERDTELLGALVAGMIAISIATGVLGVGQTYLSNSVGQQVMHDLRSAVYRHLQRLSLAFFTKHAHRRGPVADRQRHRRRAERRHHDRDVDHPERDDGRRDDGRDDAARLAAGAVLARRPAVLRDRLAAGRQRAAAR